MITHTSERGKKIIEYKDLQDRVIRRDVEVSSDTILTTHYVYDIFERLAYTISPEAYKLFSNSKLSISESDQEFKELIFAYRYDARGNNIRKHIPGAGWTEICYDKLDRPVMLQDQQEAAKTPKTWQFLMYDPFNRVIKNGLTDSYNSSDRDALQTQFNGITTPYEQRTTTGLFYSNNSFPITITDAQVMKVNYYDDYQNVVPSGLGFQTGTGGDVPFSTIKMDGLMVAMQERNLETNTLYVSTMYYDDRKRMVNSNAQNHVGGTEHLNINYSFTGELLKALKTTDKGTIATKITEQMEYQYDHLSRKINYNHTLNGVRQNVANYSYDAISRMIQKGLKPAGSAQSSKQTGNWTDATTWLSGFQPSLNDNVTITAGQTITIPSGQSASAGILNDRGTLRNFGTLYLGTILPSSGASDLETVDYSYHIRGGLRGINLDNAGNLTNKIFSMKLGYEEGGYFDGNISSQSWKTAIDNLARTYTFSYDGASRILSSAYSGGKTGENYSLENMAYDLNGNIKTLSRNGKIGANTWGYIDQLSYVYENNSNKMKKVSDLQGLSNQNVGDFRDSSNVATEYEYWQDGSLKIDRNKKISQIDYNYLKLPKQVTFEGGQWIRNQYDASGKKLKSTTSDGIMYDFVSNKIYKNDKLYQISHDEGRIVDGQYEYNYKDHLGNLRVSFRDSSGIAKIVSKLDYDPWGLTLKGLDYSNPIINKQNFQFGSKEKVESFGLNWIDFGARQYMPDVPHFTTIDPHAEKYESISPFSYCFDNPIKFLDIKGNDPGDVVILFSGANLNSSDKEPYGITTQIKNSLDKNSNGAKIGKFLSDYAKAYETGSAELPIAFEQNFDKLTQEAYDYIKANLEKNGRVAIYGYSWGGVLATYLAKRLKKENIDVSNLILIDAADGPFSSKVDRNISDNVDNFVNIYQENPSSINSRGYPATKESSKTKGININVSYVRDKSGKFVKASHTNVDDDSLQGVVNNLINLLNNKSNGNTKK